MPLSKSYHLLSMCSDLRLNPNAVLFIDDDRNNCNSAALEGYPTLTLRSRQGFRVDDLLAV